jgi:hypothetical protein
MDDGDARALGVVTVTINGAAFTFATACINRRTGR